MHTFFTSPPWKGEESVHKEQMGKSYKWNNNKIWEREKYLSNWLSAITSSSKTRWNISLIQGNIYKIDFSFFCININ